MDPLMQLRSNVTVLTIDHTRKVTVEGVDMYAPEPGLIHQLRQEIRFGSTKTSDGGGASGGVFSPFDIGSDEILTRILDGIRTELNQWAVWPDTGRLERSIHTWMKLVALNPDLHHHAASVTGKWIWLIRNLFEPVKLTPIRSDCPKCGGTPDDNGRMDDDGGWVHVPPLTVTKGMDAAKCAMCEYEWWGAISVRELGGAVQQMAEAVPRNMQG